MDESTTMKEGISLYNDTVEFNFWYPRSEGEPTYLTVGLYDVRAADDLRISYDFDRDGWKIEQAWTEIVVMPADAVGPTYEDNVDRWEEVAFIKAWKLNAEKGQAGPGSEDRKRE